MYIYIISIVLIVILFLIFSYLRRPLTKEEKRSNLEKYKEGKEWLEKYDEKTNEKKFYSDIMIYSKNKETQNIYKAIKDNIEIVQYKNNKKISPTLFKCFNDYLGDHPAVKNVRDFFIGEFSYSVPNEKAIGSMAKFIGNDTCLEVGAGLGLWSYLLIKDYDIKMIVTDDNSTHYEKETRKKNKYCDIIDINAENAVKQYRNANVLMMIWPPYDNNLAVGALKEFEGNKLIYIGEPKGGCTGTDEFFELLKKEWTYIKPEYNINNWPDIKDQLFFYERK